MLNIPDDEINAEITEARVLKRMKEDLSSLKDRVSGLEGELREAKLREEIAELKGRLAELRSSRPYPYFYQHQAVPTYIPTITYGCDTVVDGTSATNVLSIQGGT